MSTAFLLGYFDGTAAVIEGTEPLDGQEHDYYQGYAQAVEYLESASCQPLD